MKIKVLCEDSVMPNSHYLAEHGFSAWIEDSGMKILFDTGRTDVFIRNAEKLGIDLLDLDYIVLSHCHDDHTGGLKALVELYESKKSDESDKSAKPILIAHTSIFRKLMVDDEPAGCPVDAERLGKVFDVKLTDQPVNVTRNLVYMGEIKETSGFEGINTKGVVDMGDGALVLDSLNDDSGLYYLGKDGLVLIVGCSHHGICSFIMQALKQSGYDSITDIIGGLHLIKAPNERIMHTGMFFNTIGLEKIHACHCSTLKGLIGLSKYVEVLECNSGFEAEYL